ncbi:MAG: HAMP domain-containing histidine kinase [Ottowia sp.]|nr:HAMP domain-containing histidine kinase [Ottowia sp.]
MAHIKNSHNVKHMFIFANKIWILALFGLIFIIAITTFYVLTKLLASPPIPNFSNYTATERMQLACERFFSEANHPYLIDETRQKEARKKFNIFYSKLDLLVNDSPRSHAFMQTPEYVVIANKLKIGVNSLKAEKTWDPSDKGFVQQLLVVRELAAELNNKAYSIRIEQYDETLRRLRMYKSIALLIYGATVVFLGITLYIGLKYRQGVEEYAEAIRLKNLFISEINHEIRTPIQSLLNAATLLSGKITAKQDKVLVDTISKSTEKIMSKMQEFGDYSKLEIGTLGTSSDKFVINDILQDIAHDFTPLAERKSLYFHVESNFPADCEFVGDNHKIKQVLSILIGNAIKFTHDGGISLHVSIEKNGIIRALHFSVTDTGIGIKKDDVPKIFDPFVQLNNDISHTGSGLGLTIAKQITKLLNGKIYVRSVFSKGTRFDVRIPVK